MLPPILRYRWLGSPRCQWCRRCDFCLATIETTKLLHSLPAILPRSEGVRDHHWICDPCLVRCETAGSIWPLASKCIRCCRNPGSFIKPSGATLCKACANAKRDQLNQPPPPDGDCYACDKCVGNPLNEYQYGPEQRRICACCMVDLRRLCLAEGRSSGSSAQCVDAGGKLRSD